MEISNIDISTLLNMIDTFYNNAWNRLTIILIIVGGVIGLIGVAWPVLLKKFTDYQAKMEVEKLEKNLKDQFQNLSDENAKLIKNRIDKGMNTLSEEINKAVTKKLDDVDIKINVARGLIWHTLGRYCYDKKDFKLAFIYYFNAFESYYDGKDESNLQRIVNSIISCYEEVNDLSLLKKQEMNHSHLIEKLHEINENGRYSITIEKIEEKYKSSLKRLKEGKN